MELGVRDKVTLGQVGARVSGWRAFVRFSLREPVLRLPHATRRIWKPRGGA